MKPLDKNLLRPAQVQELNDEKVVLENTLRGDFGYQIQDRGAAVRKLRNIDKMLADQAPEELTGPEKDKLAKEEKELREQVTYGMLSKEEMRKNPPTAVDRHIRWEAGNKKKIDRWKNIRLQLNAGTQDRDVANLEQYRPETHHGIMTDAQIPGKHAMSPKAKENWPLGEPTADTALKQVERKEKLRMQAAKMREAKAKKAEGG
jgi:hypothetical protein